MRVIQIFTDGAFKAKTKKGVAGFIVLEDKKVLCESARLYSDLDVRANQQMELQGVINALNWVKGSGVKPSECRVYVYTDSQVIQLAYNNWIARWRENGWRNSKGKLIKNHDRWAELDEIIQKHFPEIYINWVESHTGNKWNTAVDMLCSQTLRQANYENVKVQGSELFKFKSSFKETLES